MTYTRGEIYKRADIHAAVPAGLPPGNATAGITLVGADVCVFWNPYKRLYANRWISEPSEFQYSGEGSNGDQQVSGGNARLVAAEISGTPVHVFYKIAPAGSQWLYLGEFALTAHEWGVSPGTDGKPRADLRFQLLAQQPGSVEAPLSLPVVPPGPPPTPPTEDDLWAAIAAKLAKFGGQRRRATVIQRDKRQSDPLKSAYVVERAIAHGGRCELCDTDAGWLRDDGRPHFQAHHIDADIDLVDWIAALCGSCHDRMHHAADRQALADALRTTIRERQLARGRAVYDKDSIPV